MHTPPTSLNSVVRTAQIATVAMIMAAVIFAGVAAFLIIMGQEPAAGGGNNEAATVGILGAAAVIVLIAGVVASFVVPGVVARAVRRSHSTSSPGEDDPPDVTALAQAYQRAHVVRLALLEMPEMLLCLAAVLEHNWIWLGLVLVPLAVKAAAFPTEDQLRAWLETQQMLSDTG